MWTIADNAAPVVADTVYANLTAAHTPDATKTAAALHAAVNQLRATHLTEPLVWASYIHIGP